MKNVKLVCFMAMTGLFLFLGGCQKDEAKKVGSVGITLNEFLVNKANPIFYQFFSDDYITDQNDALRKLKNRSLNPLIDTFKTDLINVDTSGKFIQFIVDKEGYPIWDFYKYYLSESGDKHIVFIPVAKITSNQITGLFIGIKDIESTSKFEIKYFSTEYFNEIISSNIFRSLDIVTISHCIIFNQQIFDYNNEDFMDWLILNLDDFNQNTTQPRCQVITICWDPPLYAIIGPKVVSNRQQECRTFTFCDGGLYNGSDPPGGFIGGPILGGDGTWVDSDGDGVPDRGLPGGVDDGTGYPGAGAGNTENHPDFLAELAKELGISVECLNKLDKVAKMTLTQIKANQVYIDPCDPNKNSNEILGEEIQSLCTSTEGKVTSDMLKNSLDDSYVSKEQYEKLLEMFEGTGIEFSSSCDEEPVYVLNQCEEKLLEKYGNSAKLGLLASGYAAQQWTVFKFGNSLGNDCSDAFRHAMLNALSSSYLGVDIAKEFGDAHECDNTPQQNFEGVMDLHNNQMGRTIYNYLPKSTRGHIPTFKIADEICKRLQNGDLKVFSDPSNNQSTLVPSHNCKCN